MQDSEKDDINNIIYTCRTCLGLGTSKKVSASLCYIMDSTNPSPSGKPVRYYDVLLQLVPQMGSTVSQSDRICLRCRRSLKQAHTFIKQCLEVEEQLQESLHGPNVTLEGDGEPDPEYEVQEYIENVVPPEAEVSKIKSEDNYTPPALEDHCYIKSPVKRKYSRQPKPPAIPETKPKLEKTKSEKIYICELCGKSCKSSTNLRQHQISHKNENLPCPDCPRVFKCKIYLDRHQQVHKKDKQFQFMCAECGKMFGRSCALVKHTQLQHMKLKPYKCDICDKMFGRADYLKKHMERHIQWATNVPKKGKLVTSMRSKGKYKVLKEKVPDQMLPCKMCGKSYKGFDKLKLHLERHALVRRYGCKFCPMTYKLYSTLKKHEQWHLEEDGLCHRCNICWRRFTDESEYLKHMTRHSNPRYECVFCPEKFHRKYLLDNHVLVDHATPEDVEISQKRVVYDTLVELAEQSST